MMNRHIFLIGMPGCGKSSLGKRVAGNLGVPYVDTDSRIEQILGCPTTDIFARYGEQAFRNAETNILAHLTREPGSIVSTGGGMVLRENNREIMRNHGLIVLIDRPLEDILSDIKLDRRPTLRDGGLAEVERVYKERLPVYRELADITLKNDQGYHMAVYILTRLVRERL